MVQHTVHNERRVLIFFLTFLELSNRERGCHLQATASPSLLKAVMFIKREYTYWNFFVL